MAPVFRRRECGAESGVSDVGGGDRRSRGPADGPNNHGGAAARLEGSSRGRRPCCRDARRGWRSCRRNAVELARGCRAGLERRSGEAGRRRLRYSIGRVFGPPRNRDRIRERRRSVVWNVSLSPAPSDRAADRGVECLRAPAGPAPGPEPLGQPGWHDRAWLCRPFALELGRAAAPRRSARRGLRARERLDRNQRHGHQQRQRESGVADASVPRKGGRSGQDVSPVRHPDVSVSQLRGAKDHRRAADRGPARREREAVVAEESGRDLQH